MIELFHSWLMLLSSQKNLLYLRVYLFVVFHHFDERLHKLNWDNYYNDLPFNPSALSLFKWAPIADELKALDRKIVLNSMILKWDIVKKEFRERINF